MYVHDQLSSVHDQINPVHGQSSSGVAKRPSRQI